MSLSDTSKSLIRGTLASLALAWGIVKLYRVGSREPHLPPGPPTKPILGNLSILPRKETYLRFTEWARQYGGIYSLKVASSTVIVITSLEAICHILDKNGAVTADRPQRAALIRIFGPEGSISAAAYGPEWRNRRRAIAEVVKPLACVKHIPIQMAETSQLMWDLENDPENFFFHIQRAILSIIFSVICGVRTRDINSPVLTRHFHLTELLMEIAEPGNTPPIDLIPILDYVPDKWLGNWKARCDKIRQLHRETIFNQLEHIEERRKQGLHNGCYLETLLDMAEDWELDREAIAYIAAGLILGGSNTTTSTLQFAILLATAFPEAQRKAQEELDRVIGTDRSPTLDDMPNLPYVKAFLQELRAYSTF
ncbi:hypothetical protein FRC03_009779 [Tulasnella sp. 419]|nr:hypothetical protein FRC03_009779 [Tulasnella sp. 419]